MSAKFVGIIVGLVIFAVWMSIVGNPHVVETIIGLALAIAGGFWCWRMIVRRSRQAPS